MSGVAIDVVGNVSRQDMVAHYHWADVLLLPSICEGSAMVTYEAHACGLPIIATPNAGAYITPGVDGIEIPPFDSESIAYVLDRLLADSDELGRLSEGAALSRNTIGRDAYRGRIADVLAGAACLK
jgi:glycosyltransferase involved in cell wall biosynthesis